jgi:PAS domain S-box-containing protein
MSSRYFGAFVAAPTTVAKGLIDARIAGLGRWLCLAGASLGLLALCGWITGVTLLTTVVPGQPSMVPNTAVALVLTGTAAALRFKQDAGRVEKVLSSLMALIVLIIGVGTLAEHAFHVDLQIDELLLRSNVGPYPGRPAPPTAAALSLLGFALLLIDFRPNAGARPSEWLILSAALIALVSLTGFLLGASPLYRLTHAPVIGVALPTAVGLLLISLGLLLERPAAGLMRVATAPGPGGVLFRRLAIPTVLAPVLLGLIVTRLMPYLRVEDFKLALAIPAAAMTVITIALLTLTAVSLNEKNAALESARSRTHQLFACASDGIFVADLDGRYTEVNDAGCRMLGFTREEILEKTIFDLIPPEDVDRLRLAREQLLKGGGQVAEWRLRKKSGDYLPVEVSATIVPGGHWQGFVRDISERKRMEVAAKLLTDRLTSAVDSIQDGFAIFDDQHQLVQCNSVYRRLVSGSLTGSLVGTPYQEILDSWLGALPLKPQDDHDCPSSERSFDVRTSDGRSLRSMARRTPEGGIVTTIWDLTEDVRLAEELREARAVAEAASNAKSDFLSSMSHELRTPLNAVLGFAQLLQRDKKEPLSDRHKERVDQILKGGEHLLRLIDDVLDLSRIEAGGLSISAEPVAVLEVVEEVRMTLEPFAARQGIRVEIEDPPAALPWVTADRTRFTQILMNFGSNAIKYNQPGGKVTFTLSTPVQGKVRVTIRDTGMGIPADKQAKLFQPFQRAGQENGPIEGTGIGLVITNRLAQLLHGSVGFRSVCGQGSEFWVDMPVHEPGARSSVPPAIRDVGSGNLAGVGRRLILYVEDNPANVTFMEDLIAGFENIDLITAPTAETGVEVARRRLPEGIIMDINLPGMSGLDALEALRDASETRDIPVIALSAAATEREKQRGIQAGFYRYLTKPVKVDEFVAVLEELLVEPR